MSDDPDIAERKMRFLILPRHGRRVKRSYRASCGLSQPDGADKHCLTGE